MRVRARPTAFLTETVGGAAAWATVARQRASSAERNRMGRLLGMAKDGTPALASGRMRWRCLHLRSGKNAPRNAIDDWKVLVRRANTRRSGGRGWRVPLIAPSVGQAPARISWRDSATRTPPGLG